MSVGHHKNPPWLLLSVICFLLFSPLFLRNSDATKVPTKKNPKAVKNRFFEANKGGLVGTGAR